MERSREFAAVAAFSFPGSKSASGMSESPNRHPSFVDVLRIVRRHRKKAIACFFFVAAGAFLIAIIWPSQYGSEAKLLVLVGRESIALDPTVTTTKTLHLDASRETEINSVMELLQCRAVLEKVVRKLGPEVILAPPENGGLFYFAKRKFKQARASAKEWLLTEASVASQGSEEDSRVEAAIQSLSKSIGISAPKSSTVITVKATAHSPKLAQRIASTLVDAYMQEHATLNRTAGSEEFFRRQKELVGGNLASAQAEFANLMSTKGIGSIAAERKRLGDEKAAVEARRLTLARELAGARARTAALTKAIGDMDEVVLAQRVDGRPNEAADGMRQQLYDIEIQERAAALKYTEEHPELKVARGQLAQLRKAFPDEAALRSETTYAINSQRNMLELELQQESARLAALQAEQGALEKQHASVLAAIRELNDYAQQHDRLDREIAFLRQSYATYSDSLEQSRIDNALKQQQITNVNIAQHATFQTLPVSPRRTLIVGGGLLLACCAAVAVPLTAENLNRKLRSPAEIEANLALPVLVSLPRGSAISANVPANRSTLDVGN